MSEFHDDQLPMDPMATALMQYQKRSMQQALAQVKPVRKGAMLLSTLDLKAHAADPTAKPVEKPKIALDFVTPEAAAAFVAYPRHLMSLPDWSGLPTEVFSALGKQSLGFDPVELDEVLVLGEPPTAGPPQYAVLLQFASPVAGDKALPMLLAKTTASTLADKPYQKGKTPLDPGIFQVDEKTLIVGTDGILQRMVANHAVPKEGPLTKMLSRAGGPDMVAVVMIKPMRPLIEVGLAVVPPQLPPPLLAAKKLPSLTDYVALTADLNGTLGMRLTFCGNDDASTQEIEQILGGLIEFGQQMMMGQAAAMDSSKDPTTTALGAYAKRASVRLAELLKPVRKEKLVSISGAIDGISVGGPLGGLVASSVRAARGSASGAQSANNLRQIALAAHAYATDKQTLPPRASFDKQGKPLLSCACICCPIWIKPIFMPGSTWTSRGTAPTTRR